MKTIVIPFAYSCLVRHGGHQVDRNFVEDFPVTPRVVTSEEAPVVVKCARPIRRSAFDRDPLQNDIRLIDGQLYEPVRTEFYNQELLRQGLTPTIEEMPDEKIRYGIFATISPGHAARSVGTTKLKGPPKPARVILGNRDRALEEMKTLERDLLLVDGVFHVRIRNLSLVAGPAGVRLGEGEVLHDSRMHLFWLDEVENATRRTTLIANGGQGEVPVEPFTIVDATWLSGIDREIQDTAQLLLAAYDLEKNVASAAVFPTLPLSAMYAFDDLRAYRLSQSRYDTPRPPSPTELRRLISNLCDEAEAAGFAWTGIIARDVLAASLDREPDEFLLAPAIGS